MLMRFFIYSYRAIVLRALPNLKRLDNIEVTPEEVDEAMQNPIILQPTSQQQHADYEDQNIHQEWQESSPVREV